MNSPARILVVDDNLTNRCVLVKLLQKAGYETIEACDGLSAVEMAEEHKPQLILLDIMMPRLDGFATCRTLKSRDSTAAIPVIFVTAKRQPEDIDKALSLGACDYISKPFRVNELKARISVHLQLQRAREELVERNKQLEEMSRVVAETNLELARHARLDSMTGLLSRAAWEEAVALEHDRRRRHKGVYAVAMIDVDHFKSFNDSQGHQAGDDCLKQVAHCIQATCRTTDIVGRYGGEEFVVLAPETGIDAALGLADRIRRAVFDLHIAHPTSLVAERVTISVGVAGSAAGSWEDVLKRADCALYSAKNAGRNRVAADPPAAHAQEDAQGTAHTPTVQDAPGDICGANDRISVLVVDDNATNRTVCRGALEREKYRVREAADGRAALEEVNRDPPHVILMDAMMPVMDGLECTRRLKAHPSTREIPVIMVSARGDSFDIQAGLQAGADEYLTKPIRTAELALRVRSMARRYREHRSLLQSFETRGEQTRVLSLLLDLCRTLGAISDLDAALAETVSATAALTGCRRVAVMLPEVGQTTLTIARSIGIDEKTAAGLRIPIGEPIVGRVFRSGRPIVINSEREGAAYGDPNQAPLFVSAPTACTPLGTPEHIVGVLNVTDRLGNQPFTPRDLEYVNLIAGIAGTAIHGILTRRRRDEARDSIMIAFAKLAEHRDSDTGRHVDRVTRYCLILADELRKDDAFRDRIDDAFMYDLERAVPLHDIGKVAIPDRILLKPGRLTPQETTIMRTHAQIGAETIRAVRRRAPGLSMLKVAEEITSSHHEWYDGSGYPAGLRGESIPLCARIVALADVYDAITTRRVYKEASTHDDAIAIILKNSGTQFDPNVVQALLRRESDFKALAAALADAPRVQPENRAPQEADRQALEDSPKGVGPTVQSVK